MVDPYSVGTITVSNGGTVVTGTSTFWVGKVRKNDLFTVPAQGLFARVTADPTENDELAINGWPGTDLVDAEYEIISTYIAVDTASRTRELLLGLSLIDPNWDAHVDTLPDRAAFDDKPGPTPTARGFAVLVDDIGDGTSAIYSKNSNASADWSGAARFSGPTGGKGWSPQLVAESDGERRVLKLAGYVGGEGTEPTDNVGEYLKADGTWTATIGDAVDFRGEGFVFVPGEYDNGFSYPKNSVARQAGSSWIALQATTGNAPPTLPTTSNAYWELMAQKGNDGAGTGDVVGPTSSTNNNVALFDGLTGKLLKDGGSLLTQTIASQTEAETGTENTKRMTALRSRQGLLAIAPRFDAAQALTRSQKGQVLANIGAGWEIVLPQSASGATSLIWPDLAIYRMLFLLCSIAPAASAPIALRHSKDNGATWLSGASEYHRNANTVTSTPNTPVYSSDNYRYLNTIANCNAGEAAQSEVVLSDWNVGGRVGSHWRTIFYSAVDGSRIKTDGSGTTATTGPHNALQLSMPGSTFNGAAVLMGIRG